MATLNSKAGFAIRGWPWRAGRVVMVVLNKIYTRTGDDGTTALGSGRREHEIDGMNRFLEPLRSFVLPGGTPASSFLHLARTVSRRAERLIVALASRPEEPVSEPAIRYVNRLSDFLFVAARYANGKGNADVLWVPGKNR